MGVIKWAKNAYRDLTRNYTTEGVDGNPEYPNPHEDYKFPAGTYTTETITGNPPPEAAVKKTKTSKKCCGKS